MNKKKLDLGNLEVQSFVTEGSTTAEGGTVKGHQEDIFTGFACSYDCTIPGVATCGDTCAYTCGAQAGCQSPPGFTGNCVSDVCTVILTNDPYCATIDCHVTFNCPTGLGQACP